MKKLMAVGLLCLSMLAFGKDYSQYKSNVLVSPETAKEIIEKQKNVVVIDVRPGVKYMTGNVKGSYNLWRPDMEPQDKRYGEIGGMRASRQELEKEFNNMGITNDTTLVLVGDNLDEYRLWWILDLYNGANNVKIVDGGFTALKETGIATKMGGEADAKKGNFKFPQGDKDTLITFEDLKKNLNNKEYAIIDTRSEGEHLGKELKKGAFLEGTIPNSVWIEWTQTLDAKKQMKSYEELVTLYEKNGITKDKIVVPYCQSAVRSAHTTFVLKELLGYPTVKNYDGSWIEWSYEAKKGNAEIINGKK